MAWVKVQIIPRGSNFFSSKVFHYEEVSPMLG